MPDPAPLVIVQPGEARSFWQPVPANGFVQCLLESGAIGAETPFAMGTQTVDAGCFVREHQHPANEEVILVLEGRGEALLDGTRTAPLEKGTCLFIGKARPHRFQAAPEAPMTFLWLMLPGGLETFFARIGRERHAGEAPPVPFPRPDNVTQIESETVFGALPPRP
ncbi:cupin domain-containing protein [Plastoroseomonas arctica]|uniref:Cupin domain-containing protein n=1 Tax=Plastoroseomonas arctica TaxID=1509237 RepID=A0AAF1KMW6_9PROT|nr:cupin domain-containing protein [Plastoroseomonas arctica]MBR0656906.1 cupin domain-containing protein [Plastoroseomonas arctica]